MRHTAIARFALDAFLTLSLVTVTRIGSDVSS